MYCTIRTLILYYDMLCYTVLHYTIAHYTILYYTNTGPHDNANTHDDTHTILC